jgi:hypothetical protein
MTLERESALFIALREAGVSPAGAQSNKLITSIYSKEGWRPTIGGVKDVIRKGLSIRFPVIYLALITGMRSKVRRSASGCLPPRLKTTFSIVKRLAFTNFIRLQYLPTPGLKTDQWRHW